MSAKSKVTPAQDDQDTAELFRAAYDTLHELAADYLQKERKDHTLQPTALVHEAYLKLERPAASPRWQGKTHFKAVAARAMRQILVDHARRRAMLKRGGNWQRVTLSTSVLGNPQQLDFLALEEALQRLFHLDARKAQVVELRYFGGMTTAEIARQLKISSKTAEADWYFARAWLRKQLAHDDSDG